MPNFLRYYQEKFTLLPIKSEGYKKEVTSKSLARWVKSSQVGHKNKYQTLCLQLRPLTNVVFPMVTLSLIIVGDPTWTRY